MGRLQHGLPQPILESTPGKNRPHLLHELKLWITLLDLHVLVASFDDPGDRLRTAGRRADEAIVDLREVEVVDERMVGKEERHRRHDVQVGRLRIA